MKRALLTILFAIISVSVASATFSADIIFLRDKPQDVNDAACKKIIQNLSASGYSVSEVDGAALKFALASANSADTVLIMPDARFFPVNAKEELEQFLKRGNHLLCIGGPAFSNMSIFAKGKWIAGKQVQEFLAENQGRKIIDFSEQDISKWSRFTGSPQNVTEWKVEPSGNINIPNALHVTISKLDDYEFLAGPPLDQPFPNNYTITTFWAKGGPNTPELKIEWTEKDTSRWKCIIKLTQDWKRYALKPEDFTYWGSKNAIGRGGPNDKFNPANAQNISFELANSITNQKMGISHEYWVSDIRAVENVFAAMDFNPPILESISPEYKTYNTTVSTLQGRSWSDKLPSMIEVTCPIPRSAGLGADKVRKWRYIPLIKGLDNTDTIRGDVAHLFINNESEYKGSVWGYIGLPAKSIEQNKRVIPTILYMIKRMKSGIFLSNAGTEHFCYILNEKVKCGAFAVNRGNKSTTLSVSFDIFEGTKLLNTQSINFELPPNAQKPTAIYSNPITLSAQGEYSVRTRLYAGPEIIDEIIQPFSVVRKPNSLNQNEFISVKDGQFWLNGKPWRGLGVNYWPRYFAGQEPQDYPLKWLLPEHYNPELIERDLELAKKSGFNLLSIQYLEIEQARCLMDFLARAQKHGFKVNVYISGLHPLEQNFKLAKDLIESANLSNNPTVFAYDIGWEVHVGEQYRRDRYNYEWNNWVNERYGSIEAACKDWNYKPDVKDNMLSGPTDQQIMNDGPWRIFVAAYRRFWDDEISKRYKYIRDYIKTLDNNHLISARSGLGGNGTPEFAYKFPFDLASGAKHLDFISPESYSSNVNRIDVLRNAFTTNYARFVSGGKPVYWSEYGRSVISIAGEPASFEIQQELYKHLVEMFIKSHSNAHAAWWWPGGYRKDENADYGIINPDGTLRPSAVELKNAAKELLGEIRLETPKIFFNIDRDKHVNGYAGLYAEHSKNYAIALSEGNIPGIKTEATGKTSIDVPNIAVGNVPYNGSNPPKYLNAEFNYVKINGVPVTNGKDIAIEANKEITIEASIGNTAEAKWIASNEIKTGAVYMAVQSQNGEQLIPIVQDTPFLSDAKVGPTIIPGISTPQKLILKMVAKDRAYFGEVFSIRLMPR